MDNELPRPAKALAFECRPRFDLLPGTDPGFVRFGSHLARISWRDFSIYAIEGMSSKFATRAGATRG